VVNKGMASGSGTDLPVADRLGLWSAILQGFADSRRPGY